MKQLLSLVAVSLMVVLVSAGFAVAEPYPYDGAWIANDQDIFSIQISSIANPGSQFYMYDISQDTTDSMLILDAAFLGSQTVYFTNSGGSWYAGLNSGGLTLQLDDNAEFGFYFVYGSSEHTSYLVTEIALNDVYDLFDSNTLMKVRISDVQPLHTPEPATLFLFGSGLIGLAGFSRWKFRRKE